MILDLDQANKLIDELTADGLLLAVKLAASQEISAARGRLLAEAEAKEAVTSQKLGRALLVIKAMTETLEDITRRVVGHCEDAAEAGEPADIDAPIPYTVNGG